MEYHEICMWLPYRKELVDEIADDISRNGYKQDKRIILFEGKILDGRHRYEAARKVGVNAPNEDFLGTKEEAIQFVTSENVKRRMLSNREKEFFYVQRAEALGVQSRGAPEGNNNRNGGGVSIVSNDTFVPSQEDHADSIGVSRPTVARWEKGRKEIKSDPELSEKAKTFDGYVEAKKELKERKARKLYVPPYNIEDSMGCIVGVAMSYCKDYEGTNEEAADILVSFITKGCEQDSIDMSISRDNAKWFLELKKVMDLAEPKLHEFLEEEPKLNVVK